MVVIGGGLAQITNNELKNLGRILSSATNPLKILALTFLSVRSASTKGDFSSDG